MTETSHDTKSEWRQSWKAWFQTPKGKEAKTILEKGRKKCADPASLTHPMEAELGRITTRGGIKTARETEPNLSAELQRLTLHQLREHLAVDLGTLRNEEISWHEKRNVGWRKVTTGLTRFLQDFDTFLSSFSGIVGIVNMADNQYGGAAILVLAVFFATVKLKAANNHYIQSCMRTIANRLPDLEIYHQIFADDVLATMLASAYTEIVIFARTATLYFQDHGFGRWIRRITHPQGFQDQENGLDKIFGEIRIQCDALLSQRIARLAHDNERLQQSIDELSRQLEEAESRRDDETRRILFNRKYSEPKRLRHQRLVKLRQLLGGELFHTYSDSKLVLTLETLKQEPKYKTWSEKLDSSMLVLHGNNKFEYSVVPQCWLSLAPFDLVFELQALGASKTAVAYFNCDSGGDHDSTTDVPKPPIVKPEQVLYNIAEQLLEQQAKIMRNMSDVDDIAHRLKRIHSDRKGHQGAEDNSTATTKSMIDDSCQIIIQILRRCQTQTLCIIIDSLELCKGGDTWCFVRSVFVAVS